MNKSYLVEFFFSELKQPTSKGLFCNTSLEGLFIFLNSDNAGVDIIGERVQAALEKKKKGK